MSLHAEAGFDELAVAPLSSRYTDAVGGAQLRVHGC